jgi:small-conductance mechanosensitive channel
MTGLIGYTPAPQPQAAPERPRSVLAATYLLGGAAAFWLAAMIATMFAMPQYERHYTEIARTPDGGALAVFGLALTAGLALIGAALFILLAFLDAFGRPAARVLSWVFGGLAIAVAGLILLSEAFTGVAWHQWLMNGIAIVTLAFLTAAVVLLGMPVSSQYFRRSKEHRQERARLAQWARYGFVPEFRASAAQPGPQVATRNDPERRTLYGLGWEGWAGIAAGVVLLAVMIAAALNG